MLLSLPVSSVSPTVHRRAMSSTHQLSRSRLPSRFALEAHHSDPHPAEGEPPAAPMEHLAFPAAGQLAVSSVENGVNSGVLPPSPQPRPTSDLEAPLLGDADDADARGGGGGAGSAGAVKRPSSTGGWAELSRISALALPLMVQNVLGYSQAVISVAFLGHVGAEALGAGVLATSFYNITGLSVLIGLTSGLETLCGQAFGAGKYELLGVFLQRAVLISLICTAPIALLWSQSASLLATLGQEPQMARLAGRYLFCLTPGLLCVCVSEGIRRFLMSQGVVRPTMYVSALVTALSFPLNYLFIYKFGMGMMGAAATVVMCNITTLTFLVLYLTKTAAGRATLDRGWRGFSLEDATRDWSGYLKLALPATIMLCIEWWLFELVILMSGWLPSPQISVSVMGLCFQITSICYMIPMSIGSSVTTRISTELGANRPDIARIAARTGLACVLTIEALLIALVLGFRHHLPFVFTQDAAVATLTAAALLPLSGSLAGDAINCILNSIIRGSGRQELGAKVGLVTWWGVGLPLSAWMGFHCGGGVVGIWGALAITTTIQSVVMGSFILLRFTFEKEAARAQARIHNASEAILPGEPRPGHGSTVDYSPTVGDS